MGQIKPEAYLAIVQERRIQERINTEVQRALNAFKEHTNRELQFYFDVQNTLDELLGVLTEVRWVAVYARGAELENAMQGKLAHISGLLTAHLDSIEKWNKPNSQTAEFAPLFSGWVTRVLRGIQRCDRAHPEYDRGDSLRGLWADEPYRAAVAYQESVKRGGAPAKPWRMILAEEIQERRGTSPQSPLKEIIQGLITDLQARQDELDETWVSILNELTRREFNKRLSLVKGVLRSYKKVQKPVFALSDQNELP